MPRFLGRLPYGAKTCQWTSLISKKIPKAPITRDISGANAAYAMGANVTRAFKLYRLVRTDSRCGKRRNGRRLPCHTFPTDDGGVDMKCPTEIAITDRREAELGKNGMMPLSHWKNTDYAVFVGGQSLQKPQEYKDPDATANANLAARLPYSSPTCRFAHYLKCIVRDKIGSFKERSDMERWLNHWITNYCTTSPGEMLEQLDLWLMREVPVEERRGKSRLL